MALTKPSVVRAAKPHSGMVSPLRKHSLALTRVHAPRQVRVRWSSASSALGVGTASPKGPVVDDLGLMPGQRQLFDRLFEQGMPEEWAHLIAWRADEERAARLSNLKDHHSSVVLASAFSWRHTPEGYEFWESVCAGLRNEDENFFD